RRPAASDFLVVVRPTGTAGRRLPDAIDDPKSKLHPGILFARAGPDAAMGRAGERGSCPAGVTGSSGPAAGRHVFAIRNARVVFEFACEPATRLAGAHHRDRLPL